MGVEGMVVDVEDGVRLGKAESLADLLGVEYRKMEEDPVPM